MFSFVCHVSATFTPIPKFLCVYVLSKLLEEYFTDQEDLQECPLKLEQQLGKLKTLVRELVS